MNDENNTQPAAPNNDQPATSPNPQPPITSAPPAQPGVTPAPGVITPTPAPQDSTTPTPGISDLAPSAPATSEPTVVGVSASQMGLDQPPKKGFNLKKILLIAGAAVLALGVAFVVLVLTNVISLSELKTTSYRNSMGTTYQLHFYAKHTTEDLDTGNKQLVSKVSKDGKFPVVLSISTSDNTEAAGLVKDCGNGFSKVFEVQNANLNEKLAVCNLVGGEENPDGVYIAGFAKNNQAHIVTISQDMGGLDVSSQEAAQKALPKFGLEPYRKDIESIIASIKVE